MTADDSGGQEPGHGQHAGAAGTTTLPGHPDPGSSASLPGDAPEAAGDRGSARWEAAERAAGASMALRPVLAGRARPLGGAAIRVLAGMGLAAHAGHPAAAVAVVTAVVVLGGLTVPANDRLLFGKRQPQEPDWVPELQAYRAWLPRRVPAIPAATLAAADQILGGLAGSRWRSAHLFIARYPDGKPGMTGATFVRGNRLQVTLGDYAAEGDPAVAATILAHEARHTRPWPDAVKTGVLASARSWGPFLVGWAVPWPAVIAALLALHVACTLLAWSVEISCDLGAAADTSPAAVLASCDEMTARARHRSRGVPLPAKLAKRALYWAFGPAHPPAAVRRAVIRARYWRQRTPR